MDKNNENNDITTIRVKISDDDYTDIIMDWTLGDVALNRLIFQQLSVFTGINIECLFQLEIHPSRLRMLYRRLNNPDYKKPERFVPECRIDKRDFRKGECYRLQTRARFDINLSHVYADLKLIQDNMVDARRCTNRFCHTKGTRNFTDRSAKVLNSDMESYLQALDDRPTSNLDPEEWMHDDVFVEAYCQTVIKIGQDLDIGFLMNPICAAVLVPRAYFSRNFRVYAPERG